MNCYFLGLNMNESSLSTLDGQASREPLRFTVAELPQLTSLEDRPAEEILRWALRRWSDRCAIVTSFQAEGMVLLDMAWRIYPGVRVVTLDTGRLHPETYDLMDRVRDRYGLEIEVFVPEAREVERLVRKSGPNLFYRSLQERQACCQVRKVAPLTRVLAGVDAWVTGLRRDQAASRAGTPKAQREARRGPPAVGATGTLVKLCPLADWAHGEVWAYLRARAVPTHRLYNRGYTSIGCQPCTRPTGPGEDPRAGRWWWEASDHKECGLHLVQTGSQGSMPPLAGVSP